MNAYVFLFFFAFGFLLAGKRPMLALSTRALLVVLFGLALSYAISNDKPYHNLLGITTLIANVVFIGFAAIDFLNWQKRKLENG